MAIEEMNDKLKHLITCMKCEVSGKCCDDNCPTQYEAGNMGEIIENLEEISKILEQEPCEMTAEEYGQKMIRAFHNSDCDELIAVCVQPTEKEFEHLEWLLKNHYKKEPCDDAISRQELLNRLDDFNKWCKDGRLQGSLFAVDVIKDMPPVTPKHKTGKWIIKDRECNKIWLCQCSQCEKDPQDYVGGTENWWLTRLPKFCPNCGAEMKGAEE